MRHRWTRFVRVLWLSWTGASGSLPFGAKLGREAKKTATGPARGKAGYSRR